MRRFYLYPGSIASILYVTPPEGRKQTWVYMAEGKLPQSDEAKFDSLPLEVRAAINRHFGVIFSLPVWRRETYLKACIPWVIEVEG